jgi:hypothetical protein
MELLILLGIGAVGIWAVLGFPGLTSFWIGPRPTEVRGAVLPPSGWYFCHVEPITHHGGPYATDDEAERGLLDWWKND